MSKFIESSGEPAPRAVTVTVTVTGGSMRLAAEATSPAPGAVVCPAAKIYLIKKLDEKLFYEITSPHRWFHPAGTRDHWPRSSGPSLRQKCEETL
jgi:hypothetical protein